MKPAASGLTRPFEYADRDVQRKARILGGLISIAVLFDVLAALASAPQRGVILLSALPQVVAFVLLRAGRYSIAVKLIIVNGFLTILTLSLLHPLGIYSELPLGIMMLMLLAAALEGRTAVVWATGLGVAMLVATRLFGEEALADVAALEAPTNRMAILIGMVLISGFLTLGVLSSLTFKTRQLTEEVETRRKAEAALAAARDAAMQSDQAKTEFLANMSHEIRTPMNAIVSISRMLAEADLPEEHRDNAEIVCKSSESLLNIINDVLDFSRVESGRLELHKRPVEIMRTVSNIQRLLQSAATAADISLTYRLAADVPKVVVCDPMRLEQVLINLVGNAIKFTEHGLVSIDVTLAPTDRPGTLAISVSDTGIGIPEGDLERIFEPFTQYDGSMTREHTGTGLGLSISKSIVELMGGEIWVSSAPDEGSVFVFTIDAEPYQAPAESTTISAANASAAVSADGASSTTTSPPSQQTSVDHSAEPGDGTSDSRSPVVNIASSSPGVDSISSSDDGGFTSLRVLVAEDNAVNRLVICKLLAAEGIVPALVENGVQAVQMAVDEPFDLVLMDIQMPVLDGVAAAQRIREQSTYQPLLVALTAHALVGDKERFLSDGLDGYLSKPVSVDDLGGVLWQALAARWAREERRPLE